jgi:hypothetical protein
MRIVIFLCCAIACSSCAGEREPDDGVLASPSVVAATHSLEPPSSTSAQTLSRVGTCPERRRSSMSRALNDVATMFGLSRETRRQLASFVPEPVAHAIWR